MGQRKNAIMLKDRARLVHFKTKRLRSSITLVYEKDSGELHSNQVRYLTAASAIRDKGMNSTEQSKFEDISNNYEKSKDILMYGLILVLHYC